MAGQGGGPREQDKPEQSLPAAAQASYEQGRQKAQHLEQQLEAYIHEKPLRAVLIASGVGVLLGLLWDRR